MIDTLETANAMIHLESGGAGVIARIDHTERGREYAGPLPEPTINALRELADGGAGR